MEIYIKQASGLRLQTWPISPLVSDTILPGFHVPNDERQAELWLGSLPIHSGLMLGRRLVRIEGVSGGMSR